jgi:nucleotide-binding universal stress UspA family protein
MEQAMLEHILAAIDGSEGSRKAARFAHDLAAKTGARLTLLLVLEPPSVVPVHPVGAFAIMGGRMASQDQLTAAMKLLEEVSADLPKASVERLVEVGPASDTICEQARRLGADLIVVGARGLGPGRRWLLGSVSDRVVQHAGLPVTVVH